MKRKVLTLLTILFVVSFILPSATGYQGRYFGFECAYLLIDGFLSEWASSNYLGAIFSLFLLLPNFIVIPTMLFHKRMEPNMLAFLLIMQIITGGYWIVAAPTMLLIGYWLWFISALGIMVLSLPYEWERKSSRSSVENSSPLGEGK